MKMNRIMLKRRFCDFVYTDRPGIYPCICFLLYKSIRRFPPAAERAEVFYKLCG